ncbi:MlaD family protein [Pannus brasiliensis CCIBt3594]|uniref:MlaD family protein n=1 Tax=Pannus brasiliensis CCIBt3594 TaxID=1427578 RepID=A0AAW9QR73_9CHRO
MQARGSRQRISPTLLQSGIGLLLLASGGILIWLISWLSHFSFGGRSYRATILFPNVGGMLVGTRVGYRGVRVGQVIAITPEPEGVAVEVEISPADRVIPSNSLIEAIQSGLVGETTIDITPLQGLPVGGVQNLPLSPNCDSAVIICNGSRLQGQSSLNVNSLIRSLLRIANIVSDPDMVASFRSFTQRASTALGSFDRFSGEATGVLSEARRSGTIGKLNTGMRSLSSLDKSLGSLNSLDSLERVSGSLDRLSNDLSGVGGLSQDARALIRDLKGTGGLRNLDSTLVEARRTLLMVGQTTEELRGFLSANQNRLVATLDSIKTTSDRLQTTLNALDPILTDVQKSQIIENLNTISASAVTLTKNLENFSTYLGDPATVVQLQQLLDSSRAAFSNLQKLTSDVDEITGDPKLRQEIIRLIQGLSRLVSSTEQFQNEFAQSQAMAKMAVQIATIAPKTASSEGKETGDREPAGDKKNPSPVNR